MSFNPLRLLASGQLFICLILFLLPWIEVQCVPTKPAVKDPDALFDVAPGMAGPRPFFTQSGLQIATGGYTVADPDLKRLMEAQKNPQSLPPGVTVEKSAEKQQEIDGAPLLFLFPVAVLAGMVLGVVLPPGKARRLVLAGCCAGALGVVGLQAAIGFPAVQSLKEKQDAKKPAAGPPRTLEVDFKTVWKFPLYLTLLLLVGAAGTAFVDGGTKKKPKPKVYDFDDEDGDDRPRKKKQKPVVEELPDDETDEPPPRKPARPAAPPPAPAGDNPFAFGDDDEDDDRPGKRR